MPDAPETRRVTRSPWPGLYGTWIDSARHYPRHWHGTYGIGVVERGGQRSASGRGPVEAVAGDVITTNPGEVHDGRPLDGQNRRWHMVYLEPALMDEWAAELGAPAGHGLALVRPVIADTALAASLRRLFARLDTWQAQGASDAAAVLACEEALAQACAPLLTRHATLLPRTGDGEAEADRQVARARERLADSLAQPPTLAALAAEAGLSRFQLIRRFRQAYGVPPHAWLVQLRVERARGLVARGAGLAGAAATCGFADQSHMTRAFVHLLGFTPGALQR